MTFGRVNWIFTFWLLFERQDQSQCIRFYRRFDSACAVNRSSQLVTITTPHFVFLQIDQMWKHFRFEILESLIGLSLDYFDDKLNGNDSIYGRSKVETPYKTKRKFNDLEVGWKFRFNYPIETIFLGFESYSSSLECVRLITISLWKTIK